MKPLTYILNAMDFESTHDMLGTFSPYFNKFLAISLTAGIFGGFIETYLGISFILWLFILVGAFFDILLGIYANVVFLGHDLDTKKMFRGVFKIFVVLVIIFLTNTFNQGIQQSNISPQLLSDVAGVISSTLHYSSVILIGLYIMLGIAENGAKIEIPFCVSLVNILKLRIKKVEDQNK